MEMFGEMDEALRSMKSAEAIVRATPGDNENPWDIAGRFGRVLTGKPPSADFTLRL